MYLYADVVLLINFILNCAMLLMTARFASISYSWWRIILSALIGSIYVLGNTIPELAFCYHPLSKIIFSFILIFIAFGYKRVQTAFILVSVFYVVSFIIGGAVLGWIYFWNDSQNLGNLYWEKLSWVDLLAGLVVGGFLVSLFAQRALCRMLKSRNVHKIRIEYGGRVIEIKALLDTGNNLFTIGGRYPVILVDCDSISHLVGEAVQEYLQKNEASSWVENLKDCPDREWLSRVQVIPGKSVGAYSLILGFRPDIVIISTAGGDIANCNVVVGIYSNHLSNDGQYEALLHPAMI